jgi:putative transposase
MVLTGDKTTPAWLEVDWILSHFSLQLKRARTNYINLVREVIGLEPIWHNQRHQIYLGNEQFITKHQKMLNDKASLDVIPMLQKRAVTKPIGNYQEQCKDKKKAIYRAYLSGGYTLKQISDHYGKHYTKINSIVKD